MIIPAALLLLLQASAGGQDATVAKKIEVVCKQVLCRSPHPIRLKQKDGEPFPRGSQVSIGNHAARRATPLEDQHVPGKARLGKLRALALPVVSGCSGRLPLRRAVF